MEIHLCQGVKENCWNIYDTYGEICVHCGCCSEDPKTQATARLEVLRRELEENENFTDWSEVPTVKMVQKANIRSNIRSIKKEIAKYEDILKQLQGEENEKEDAHIDEH